MYKYKKSNKKKKRIVILFVLLLLAIILGLIYNFLLTHTVKTVHVEGNVHYTNDEIEDMVMKDVLSHNSLYLSLMYRDKPIHNIPFIAEMSVEVISPDTIKIRVYEKALAGYVIYLNNYLYFDKEGVIVEISGIKTLGVPEISGLKFDHAIIGKPLPVEDNDIFLRILNITKTLNKYEQPADRLYFNNSKEITLYFGSIRVNFGSEDLLDEKIVLIKKLLPELNGKSGVLNLQNYNGREDTVAFKVDS